MTLKEQLIQEIRYMPLDKRLKTVETLSTGEYNEMTFLCPQESLLMIINNLFDDELNGAVPGGLLTKIVGWEVIDIPKEGNNEE